MADEKPDKKLPTQKKSLREVAFRVNERFQAMKSNRSGSPINDDKWDTWDRMSRNIPADEPPEDWMANVFVPFTQATELAIIAEITDRRPRYKLLPQAPADEDKVDTLEAITEFTFDKGRFDEEIFKMIYDKVHYGTGIWKEYYRQDRRVIKEMKRDKDGKFTDPREWEEKDIREFDDVYGKHIPIRNFYMDDKAIDIREARDCIERNILNIDDFRERYKKYRRTKKVREWGFIRPINEAIINNLPAGGDLNRDATYLPVSSLDKDDEVEVLEYWSKSKDEHIVVANGITVVEEPNPYDHKQLPYAIDVAIPLHNSPCGMGVPESMESPQDEMNTIHNMMIDETKLSIHKPILMSGRTLLDEDEYQLRPKGIIPTDDVDQAKELAMTGVAANNFQMYEEIKQSIRTATGLDVKFAEAQTTGTDTATEALQLQEASLRRIGLYQKMLMIRALPRIGMLRTANIQQFYKDPLKVKQITDDAGEIVIDPVTGKGKLDKKYRTIRLQRENESNFEFKEITPDMIRANVDVKTIPQSTKPMSDAVLAKRLGTLMQDIMAFPPLTQIVDIEELMRQRFKRLDLPLSIVKKVIGPDNDSLEQANQENFAMASGEKVPPTPNASMKHTAIHGGFIFEIDPNGRPTGGQTEQFQGLNAQAKEEIMKHYRGELERHAVGGNISPEAAGRTPATNQGVGVQERLGGEVGTETANQGL